MLKRLKKNRQVFGNMNHTLDLVDLKFIYKYIFTIFSDAKYFSSTKKRSFTSSTTKA